MADFSLNAVIICDDVRREISQKDILVGVYGSAIVVSTLPTHINLAFWIEMEVHKKGLFELFLKLEFQNSSQNVEFRLGVNIENNTQPVAVFTPQISCFVEREGQLRLLAKAAESGKYKLIKTRKLLYNPNTSAFFGPLAPGPHHPSV